MHRSLLLAVVSALAVASVALAATGDKAPKASLVQAVGNTNRAASLRYVLDISIARRHDPTMRLHVSGMRGSHVLFIHLQQAPGGQQQSAMLDGPFLYEGAPNGIAVLGHIKWVRVPVARLGTDSTVVSTVHNLSPAPLLRLLDEWSKARSHSSNGTFRGTVAYDDPIVLTALSTLTHGIEFRDVRFVARIGTDGYVHAILVTGRTADGSRTLRVTARMYAFGRPVRVTPPGEGTFMDRKSLQLSE